MRDIQGYLGTRAAAEELAVSVGTVQKLVEDGHLEGWKTLGGHRRISKNSIEKFKIKNNIKYTRYLSEGKRSVIFCGFENSNLSIFEDISKKYHDNFKFVRFGSPVEMLVSFRALDPLIMIVDLSGGDAGDLEMIRAVCSMKLSSNMKCILFSGCNNRIDEVKALEISDVNYLPKPVNLEWLDGFFASILSP